MSTRIKTTVWQHYEIDPLDLIGEAVRLTVVTDDGAASNGHGWRARRGVGHYHYGVIESIHEHRGEVRLDDAATTGDWAPEALSVDFSGNYLFVRVTFRGGHTVEFDPEKDAASFEWREVR